MQEIDKTLAWLGRTCALVERFTATLEDDFDRLSASVVIHSTADFLLGRLGPDAAFDKLDPGAFVALVARSSPDDVGGFAQVLRDFYAFLIGAGEIDRSRGQYLACYFDTLLELHGAGPTGIVPTRASRRATATLARRITEARLRSEERLRKKSAA